MHNRMINKKILIAIPSLNYGGAEILMLQQAEWLKKNGWEIFVVILSNNNDKELLKQLELLQFPTLIIQSKKSVLSTSSIIFALKNYDQLRNLVVEHNISIIVAHLPLAHLWGRLVKFRYSKIKLVVYHHSMQYQANPLNTFGKSFFNKVQKILAKQTDEVSICISEAVKQNIQQYFILNNPIVIFNAVQDKKHQIDEIRPLQFEVGKKAIQLIIPGRLHPAKGQLFFLPIFQQLLKVHNLNIHLTIAGGGNLEGVLQDYIDTNHLDAEVTITGFMPNDRLLENMYHADFVVIPSISEGLGIVAIEALMLGKTIIASDAGGLKEVLQNNFNGYLFKSGDVSDCLNACSQVLSNYPNSLFSSEKLRANYQKRFSFESHMKRLIEVL